MHLTRIQAQFRYGRMSLRKFAPQKIIKNKIKETSLKKVVPATMLVAESMASLSGHAQALNKVAQDTIDFERFAIPRFMPKVPKFEEKTLPFPLNTGRLSAYPRNNFNKSSKFLREKYKGTAEELNYFIEKMIPSRNGSKTYNPFYGKGKAFIEIGQKYNVNPTFLVAIGMQESGRGTSSAALKKNNIGGITVKSGLQKFARVEDCIQSMAQIIDKRIRENLTTVEAIGKSGKYCDKSVGDLWAKNVIYYVNMM